MGTMKKDLMRGHASAPTALTQLGHGVSSHYRQSRALRLLSDVLKLAAHAIDEQTLLADVCEVVHGSGTYPFAAIGLNAQDHAGSFRWQACEGWFSELTSKGSSSTDHRRITEMAMKALSMRQVWVDRYESGDRFGLHAVLALPIVVDGEAVGSLVLGATDTSMLSPVEIGVFEEVAVELGRGIHAQREHAARAQADQKRQDNLANFRNILSHQHAGILVVSGEGRTKFVNEAFCAQFGFQESPTELENISPAVIRDRITPFYLHPEREAERILEIVARNEAVRDDEVLMRDGRIFLRDFTPIVIDNDRGGRIWQQRDITQEKMQEARVERLAFYDVVTGLPNRRLLFDLLVQARARAVSQPSLLAVGVLDLNRCKSINESINHEGGDQVLVDVSARILGLLRDADVLARFGDDEFALVIPGLDSTEQLDAISRCILQILRAPISMSEDIYLSPSIGWTLFPLDDADPKGLLRHADLARYVANDDGKDRGMFYEPAMELEQLRLQAMRERIAQALQHSRLQLLFQPIVYIDGLPGLNGVAGMEALLRLDDAGEELVAPADFMHVLDDPQLARPIGRYVLNEALRCCQSWIHAGVSLPVSINISTRHLLHPGFFADVDAALENHPDVMDVGFGIEVTETGPTMDHARAQLVIEECRQRGIRVGLDDFGTGSASLSHIQRLDIEHIKLDQSFVRDIRSNERNLAIAAGVITTARMLAKMVIAEGVETSEQGDLLASLGCHQLQGFSISRPMSAASVPDWVAGWVPPTSWSDLANERQLLLASQRDVR